MNLGKGSVKAVNAVPLSVVKPVEVRVKRLITKTNTVVSPYLNRVLKIDTAMTNDEKQIDIYLLKKNRGDLR